MIAAKALRRKLDYQVLRWQARLDGAWADRVLPAVAAAGLFVILAALALARARSLETGAELARWVQGAWLLTNGNAPDISITGDHLFESHGSVGFAAIAQGTRLVPPIPYLIIVQALALSLGVLPIWRLCRKVCSLRAGAAGAAVVAYGLYPPLHDLNLADFHPEAIALPLLLAGAYASLRRHWWWALGFCLVAVSMRSDLGLSVAAIGVVAAIDTRSRHAFRLTAFGIAWFLLAVLVVQPVFGDGSFVYAAAFEDYGTTFHGVLWGMISDPLAVLSDLFARDNFTTLVAVAAPVAFLPMLAPRYILPIAPVLALTFVADVPLSGDGAGNLVPAIAFVFVALPFALAKIGRRNIERITVDRRLLGALTLAALVFFVQDSPSSPYERPWQWGGRSLADQARLEAIEMIADSHRVRSARPMLAELATRRDLVEAVDGRSVGGRAFTADVDVVLIDESLSASWTRARHQGVVRAIQSQGFDLVYDRDGVQLFVEAPDG